MPHFYTDPILLKENIFKKKKKKQVGSILSLTGLAMLFDFLAQWAVDR